MRFCKFQKFSTFLKYSSSKRELCQHGRVWDWSYGMGGGEGYASVLRTVHLQEVAFVPEIFFSKIFFPILQNNRQRDSETMVLKMWAHTTLTPVTITISYKYSTGK